MPATKGIRQQDVLLVFDRSDEPFLSASEVAERLDVSAETARYHLSKMADDDLVGRKKIGARAVGWWAKVAPELDPDHRAGLERRRDEEEFTPLADV